MSVSTFLVPKETTYGEGAMERLSKLKGKRAILITGGSSMKKYGFLAEAEKQLKAGGFETTIFDGVEPNPSIETVRKGAKAMLDFEPDWIVAIGGGSAIDAAKIMWCFYEHPYITFEDIIPVGSMPELRKKAKFAAIPSTSGTATEVTAFSVITDTVNHIKYPIVSSEIVPDLAILDANLPAKMPTWITAHTGMDALCHSVESVASIAATDFTTPLAMKSIELIANNLENAYKNPDDMEARTKMHNASTLAGQAFSNSSLGLVHSLAHKIGGEFGITHGLANAIMLPYVVENNRKHTEVYKDVEKLIGIADLPTYLRTLNEKLDLPNTLKDASEKDMKIDEKKFLDVLDRMSKNAHEDPCTLTNPGEPDVETVKSIYKAAFYGSWN